MKRGTVGDKLHGCRFKQARQLQQLSRVQLAEQVGVHWSVIVDAENDARFPEEDVLFRLVRTLDFPLAFFRDEPSGDTLPLGSLAFHSGWTEEEIECL